jgi:hypothetical protein
MNPRIRPTRKPKKPLPPMSPAELIEVLRRLDRYLEGKEIYEYGVMEGNGDENSLTPAKLVRAALKRAPH